MELLPRYCLASLSGYQFAQRGPCSQYEDVVEQYAVRAVVPVAQESVHWVTVSPTDMTWASCLNGWTFGNLAATPAAVARVVHAVFGSAQPRLLSSSSLEQAGLQSRSIRAQPLSLAALLFLFRTLKA